MYCILVFDSLNDIIYKQYNREFILHMKKISLQQGLISDSDDNEDNETVSSNLIMQLFSPIVTSQRVMATQFGNSYTSIHCKDGTNLCFDEYMGFLFTHIGRDSVSTMKRTLSVFISLVRHICGPDVEALKAGGECGELLGQSLDKWREARGQDQSLLVEAVEQLAVNSDITTAALTALRDASATLNSSCASRSHCLLLVQSKLLALYTSRESDDLIPSDLIFLNILASTYQASNQHHAATTPPDTDDVNSESGSKIISTSNGSSISNSPVVAHSGDEILSKNNLRSRIVFLKGRKGFRPHVSHILTISDGIYFVLIYQVNSESLCCGLYEAFLHLTNFQKLVESESDTDTEKKSFESLESAFKRISDSLKKNKNSLREVEGATKSLMSKWDILKKKYGERLKSGDQSSGLLGISANSSNLLNSLRELYRAICFGSVDLAKSEKIVSDIASKVKSSLYAFTSFLTAKAFRNFTLRCLGRLTECDPGRKALLSINKYLEEFPGLVHFLYIDRVDHRLTAPSLDFSSEETNNLTKVKIWDMIDFSRRHLEDGHLAFMWKDTTFNYAYYLWFEDDQGSPIKPKVCPANVIKTLPTPGIIGEDFYQHLVEACFPKYNVQKIHCFELYCIHLGLATSSCVLDQSRRIAATVCEVTGSQPKHPTDFI